MKRLALAVVVLLATLTAPPPAQARTALTVAYRADAVFAAAVRFLRVDEDAAIVDKDADAGYVIFTIERDGKTTRGALELIAADRDGQPRVTIAITLTDRPDYLEAVMLEHLRRKLKAELGEEAPAPPPKPRAAPEKPAAPAAPADPKSDG